MFNLKNLYDAFKHVNMYKVYMGDSKKDFKISRTVTLSKKQEEIIARVDRKLLKNL